MHACAYVCVCVCVSVWRTEHGGRLEVHVCACVCMCVHVCACVYLSGEQNIAVAAERESASACMPVGGNTERVRETQR